MVVRELDRSLQERGLQAAFRHTVTEADTAAAIGSGEVPMLATPRVLALAERATTVSLVKHPERVSDDPIE